MMRRAARHALLLCVLAWGCASVFLLACDTDGGDLLFVRTKIAGALSLGACILAGRWLSRRGWLPRTPEEENDNQNDTDYYE